MKILNIKDMKDGWFVGGFEPTAYFTKDFEDLYKKVRNCLLFCQDSGGPLYIMA
jgi:hypothetical protein